MVRALWSAGEWNGRRGDRNYNKREQKCRMLDAFEAIEPPRTRFASKTCLGQLSIVNHNVCAVSTCDLYAVFR
jgi:hypothetical protein